MSSKEVKLNLTLTAKDEAKQVIEKFAETLKQTFDGLGTRLAESMNMKAVKDEIANLSSQVNKDMKSIDKSFQSMGKAASDADKTTKESMDGVKKAVNNIKQPISSDMNDVVNAIKAADDAFKNEQKIAQDTAKAVSDAMKAEAEATTVAAKEIRTAVMQVNDALKNNGDKEVSVIDFAALQMAGDSIKGTGEKITGFFGESASAAVDFDQSITNTVASLNSNLPTASQAAANGITDLKKQLHATFDGSRVKLTSDAVDTLREKALELGKSGFYSANQVGEAMNTLARQGISYEQIMGGAMDTVHNVAAANQEDVESTANVVSDIIHEMGAGLSEEFGPNLQDQLQGVGDAMTGALHHARISMDDFLNTMKYAGPQASAMGVGITDVSAAIALLGEHGIRGSQAGTTLRRMFTNLIPQSAEAKQKMMELGMVTKDGANIFFDAEGKMKPLAEVQNLLYEHTKKLTPELKEMALKTIFGQYALSGMTAIAETAPKTFKELDEAMKKQGITQDLMADKSEGLGLQVQKLRAHFETIRKEIGELLRPIIVGIIGTLTYLMNVWDGLSKPVKKAIAVIGSVVGVVMVVGGALMGLVATMGFLAAGVEAALALLAAIGPFILPVVGIAAVVIAAIVGLVAAWRTNFLGIRDITADALSTVKKWFSDMAPSFQKALQNIVKLMNWLKPLWELNWAIIKTVLSVVLHHVTTIFSGVWKVVSGVVQLIVHLIAGDWKAALHDMWQIVKGAATLIIEMIGVKMLADLIKAFAKLILEHVKWGKDVEKFFIGLKDNVIKIAKMLWDNVKKAFHDGTTAIKDAFDKWTQGIRTVFSAFKDLFHGDIKGAWEKFKEAFKLGIEAVKTVIEGFFKVIDDYFGGLPSKAYNWGKHMIDMFVDGIKAAASKVTDAVSDVASKVSGFLGFHSPTEEGPASDSDTWMPNMMNMFHQGIVQNAPKIEAAIGNVALGVKTAFNGVTNVTNAPTYSVAQQRGGNHPVIVNINVEGRTMKTDNELAEKIADQFRRQMSVVSA